MTTTIVAVLVGCAVLAVFVLAYIFRTLSRILHDFTRDERG
jgi:hypothetical protein